MANFLIDANLPRRFSVWRGVQFEYVADIDERLSDSEIWRYAASRNLTIVTKDVDFSDRIIVSSPPPRIIHYRIGNMRFRAMELFVERTWNRVETISLTSKLVRIYPARIESIA